jgi:hypothetical protein
LELPAAQEFFHEHGGNTGQSRFCKGAAEDASGATRFPVSSESTQEVAQQAWLLMKLTGDIR